MAPTEAEKLSVTDREPLEQEIERLLRTESLTPAEILDLERELIRIRAA